ncbi:MAG: hypothetical protein IT210_03860 [Armatimonadetes bacterium]|nr:hypothetical protein [Armatimonadota bacterium]
MNRLLTAFSILLLAVSSATLAVRADPARIVARDNVTIREGETVNGDVVVVEGSATVKGRVRGTIAAIGGSVTLEPGAVVDQDAVALRGTVTKKPGAKVGGREIAAPTQPQTGLAPAGAVFPEKKEKENSQGFFLIYLILLALAALITLAMPEPFEVVADTAANRTMTAFGGGLLGFCVCLMLMIATALTLVGIPLVPFEMLICFLAFLYGWQAVACNVGRWLLKPIKRTARSLFGAMALGSFALLIGLGILGAMGGVGQLLWLLTFVFILFTGFGSVVLNAFGYSPGWFARYRERRSVRTDGAEG